ncbi:MAG TPA: molybdopterin-dependent oxidoreductase [Candidatus Sulfopaludibacter sp.]|nr:molybdopterin-dependent oxidoreductase [Candidatus Sulfopaludibacter sp.]
MERQLKDQTRRSFLTGGIAALAGYGAWRWIGSRNPDGGVAWPLRRVLQTNEEFARDYYRPGRLARQFPRAESEMPKVNGTIGIDDDDFDIKEWRLEVSGLANEEAASLTLADIQAFPKHEFVTELKCVEGWSKRVHWGGARLADFARRYRPAFPGPDSYVALATPGREYYVSLDMASALHPQTLLCYEMEGRPLEYSHGAPLRLAIPIKYGIKNIKCIGQLQFTKSRPPDFWAERGYDDYAGF